VISPGVTVQHALRQSGLPPNETRLLAAHVLGWSSIQLITDNETLLDSRQERALCTAFERRMKGEPIAYILGQREFFGLMFSVSPDVLIPRPETELLVELAQQRVNEARRPVKILDLGTGSGAIAVTLHHICKQVDVWATDRSAAALIVARRNADAHPAASGSSIAFVQGDWYAPLAQQRFDIVLSNPPYIESNDRHLIEGDLRFEPVDALTDHEDGLAALRHIVAHALPHLNPNGWLFQEHGYNQADAVRRLLSDAGFPHPESWRDLAGIERVSGARRAV
jgi:release factor glutamine methyltransferase